MSKTCIPNGQNKKDLKTGLLKFGPGDSAEKKVD